MFDFMRDRGSTAKEKRLEVLGAYLDNALTAAERARLEEQLAGDADLREELERLRVFKLQLRALSRRRVPRSFALDPALYARPKARPLMQLYPVLRGATAMTAFLLVFTLALGMFQGQFAGGVTMSSSEAGTESVAEEEMGAFAVVAESAPQMATAVTSEEARAMATPAPEIESAPADLSAQDVVTEAGTDMAQTEMPETSLDIPVATQEVAEVAEESALVPAPSGAGAETFAKTPTSEQAPADVTAGGMIDSYLLPIQIALVVLFLLLLVLWLIARRQARWF
jgi:anti-sigma factor RsiW